MVIAATLVASTGLFGVGFASAETYRLTLQFTCSSPFGDQPMTADVESNAPSSVPIDENTPAIVIDATATVGASVTLGLDLIGATSVEGTGDATAVVAAPQGDIDVTVPLTIPDTAIPATGALTAAASGTAPSLRFTEPGTAEIEFKALDLSLTPLNAGGDQTPVGTVTASCGLNSGQNDVLTSFGITGADGTAGVPPSDATAQPATNPTRPRAGESDPASTASPNASTTGRSAARASFASPHSSTPTRSATPPDALSPTASVQSLGTTVTVIVVAIVAVAAAAAFYGAVQRKRRRADGYGRRT